MSKRGSKDGNTNNHKFINYGIALAEYWEGERNPDTKTVKI